MALIPMTTINNDKIDDKEENSKIDIFKIS